MTALTGYSCRTVASGDAEFYREVAAPFAASFEQVLPPHKGEVPQLLQVSPSAQNDAITVALLSLITFVAGHLTKKVLDDAYPILIQPRIKPLLENADLWLKRKRGRKRFNVSFWYEEYKALVSVTVIGNSFADVIQQIELIPTVHANALSWIAANGIQKPVHHYTIEGGKVNAVPLLADHFQEVLK